MHHAPFVPTSLTVQPSDLRRPSAQAALVWAQAGALSPSDLLTVELYPSPLPPLRLAGCPLLMALPPQDAPASPDASKPSPEEWARARDGEVWPEGPGMAERLMLWCLATAPAVPDVLRWSLVDRAMTERWRFALAHLLDIPAPEASQAAWTATVARAMTQGDRFAVETCLAAGENGGRAQRMNFLLLNRPCAAGLDVLWEAMGERDRRDAKAWAERLGQWQRRANATPAGTEDGLAATVDLLATRLGSVSPASPEIDAVRQRARALGLVWQPPGKRGFRRHARLLARRMQREGASVQDTFGRPWASALLVASVKPAERLRQAAVVAGLLDRLGLESPQRRSQEHAWLSWLMLADAEAIGSLLAPPPRVKARAEGLRVAVADDPRWLGPPAVDALEAMVAWPNVAPVAAFLMRAAGRLFGARASDVHAGQAPGWALFSPGSPSLLTRTLACFLQLESRAPLRTLSADTDGDTLPGPPIVTALKTWMATALAPGAPTLDPGLAPVLLRFLARAPEGPPDEQTRLLAAWHDGVEERFTVRQGCAALLGALVRQGVALPLDGPLAWNLDSSPLGCLAVPIRALQLTERLEVVGPGRAKPRL